MKLLLILLLSVPSIFPQQYKANWGSLDTRPLPQWYDDAKFGIFLHWGIYSVPSFGNEWFFYRWKNGTKEFVEYMEKNHKPGFTYQDFAKDFTAEFFNASEWAHIFKDSGAKYVVLTSKHHEGYTLWPSKYSYSWNAKDVGPNRDLIGELSEAVRDNNLTFGLYHSLFEWFNPLFLSDQASNWEKREFSGNKVLPEMIELVETYHPEVIWSDGPAGAPDTYWNATDFIAWLYNDSPVKDTVVVNDRWGAKTHCKHGDFFNCHDRYNPGHLIKHKWENAMTIDKHSWSFRRNAKLDDYFTTLELLTQMVSTVSCGGNILMNVGPTKDGIIAPILQQRLRDIGTWLSINGEAIYSSKPWTFQNDSLTPHVWYTSKDNIVYATVLFWPEENNLLLGSLVDFFESKAPDVRLLGNEELGALQIAVTEKFASITFPDKAIVKSQWAYVLKIVPN